MRVNKNLAQYSPSLKEVVDIAKAGFELETDIGVFEVKERKGRITKLNGGGILPAMKVLSFKQSKEVKKLLNE